MQCRPLGRSRLKGEALSKLSEQLGELGEEGRNGKEGERGGKKEGGGVTRFRLNQCSICLALLH